MTRVKRITLMNNYSFDRLNMVDLNSFIISLKLTWLRRRIKMNNKFSHLVESICPFLKEIYTFGSDYTKRQLQNEQIIVII